MGDNTTPERIIAGYGFHGYEWSLPDSVMAYRLEDVTEYIRADVAQAQLDAANVRIAELSGELAFMRDDRNLYYDVARQQTEAIEELSARIAELKAEARQATEFFRTPHGEWLYGDDSTPLHSRIQAMAFEMDAKIDELEAAQTWVSVDERLPDDEDNGVIAWTNNASDYTSYNFDLAFYHKQFGWLMATEWEHGDPTVTHWMPLPPPPVTAETEQM